MAGGHVSVPKSFSDGDAREWFQRFEFVVRQISGMMK